MEKENSSTKIERQRKEREREIEHARARTQQGDQRETVRNFIQRIGKKELKSGENRNATKKMCRLQFSRHIQTKLIESRE